MPPNQVSYAVNAQCTHAHSKLFTLTDKVYEFLRNEVRIKKNETIYFALCQLDTNKNKTAKMCHNF